MWQLFMLMIVGSSILSEVFVPGIKHIYFDTLNERSGANMTVSTA